MRRASWKASERRMAEALGGKRVPITGRSRGDAPDIEHPQFAIEHKAGAVLSTRLQTALVQARAAAAGTGKTPLVTVEHFRGGNVGNIKVVMMGLDDWIEWFGPTKADVVVPDDGRLGIPGMTTPQVTPEEADDA